MDQPTPKHSYPSPRAIRRVMSILERRSRNPLMDCDDCEWLLDRGSPFPLARAEQDFDVELSYEPEAFERGKCFENAAKLVTNHPDRFAYVEGVATRYWKGNPIRYEWHAWLVCKEHGVVHDPTFWYAETPPDNAVYFGVEFPSNDIKKEHLDEGLIAAAVGGRRCGGSMT